MARCDRTQMLQELPLALESIADRGLELATAPGPMALAPTSGLATTRH